MLPKALVKVVASIVVFMFALLDITIPFYQIKQIRINFYRPPVVSLPNLSFNFTEEELIKKLNLSLSKLNSSGLSSELVERAFNELSLPFSTSVAHADVFMDTVREGQSIGGNLVESFNPQNINQTLQDKGLPTANTITPRTSEAQKQSSSVKDFYTNPGSMAAADTNTDVGTFLKESYKKRQKFDLSQDPTFGSKCLKTDAEGKCLMWSASKDIITKTYPGCERVLIPEYGDPPTEAKCTGTETTQTIPCAIRNYVRIETETVHTPCNSIHPEYKPGQIYAVCRDHYERYKVYDHTARSWCSCWNFGGAFCNTPPHFIYSAPPPGAVYLGMSYENFRNQRRPFLGNRTCDSDRFKWYAKYKYSVIERVYLQKDSPCGANINKWVEECAVSRLEQCDPQGNNCVVSIENGQNTGKVPDFDYLTKVSQGVTTTDCSSCTSYSDPDSGQTWWSCPSGGCIGGVCPPGAVSKSAPTPSAVHIGTERANVSFSCEGIFCREDTGACWGSPPSYRYETFNYYKDPLVCQNFSGSIENYLICMKYFTVEIDNGFGLRQLSQSQVRQDRTVDEYRSPITWFHIWGGPDVKPYLNNWFSKVTFGCDQSTDNCQSLRDQGCVHYSRRCLDDRCEQVEYTYRCGGTGGIKGYRVVYNCAGNIRCMGTECKDASYEANRDFSAVASALEVLHQIRVDGSEASIFPGREYTCQSSPKNCCKPNTGGVSIADYVMAAYAGYSLYTTLSTGIAATAANTAAAITATVNKISSTLGIASTVTTSAVPVLTGSGTAYVTTTMATTFAGTTITTNTVAVAGMAVGESTAILSSTTAMPSTIAQSFATAVTVIGIIIAAYTIANLIFNMAFACTQKDLETSVKLGFNLCHYLGKRCASRALGVCIKRDRVYCCYNSILARIIHQQGRPQINKSWGDAKTPNCKGFTPGELGGIDLSRVDLTEYMQYIQHKTQVSPEKAQELANKVRQRYDQSKK